MRSLAKSLIKKPQCCDKRLKLKGGSEGRLRQEMAGNKKIV